MFSEFLVWPMSCLILLTRTTYTTDHHQVAIAISWLESWWSSRVVNLYIQSTFAAEQALDKMVPLFLDDSPPSPVTISLIKGDNNWSSPQSSSPSRETPLTMFSTVPRQQGVCFLFCLYSWKKKTPPSTCCEEQNKQNTCHCADNSHSG